MAVAQEQLAGSHLTDSLADTLDAQASVTADPLSKNVAFSLLASFTNMGATLGLCFWGIALFQRVPQLPTVLLIAVLAGLLYDNIVMIAGYWLRPSARLEAFHRVRFVVHNLCIPLLVVLGMTFLGHTAVVGSQGSLAIYGGWGMSLGLMVLGLKNCKSLELVPDQAIGMLRYKAKGRSLPIPTIVTSLIMAGVGLSLWTQIQWPWLLVGTLAMLGGNAAPPYSMRHHVCSSAELGFMLALFSTAYKVL